MIHSWTLITIWLNNFHFNKGTLFLASYKIKISICRAQVLTVYTTMFTTAHSHFKTTSCLTRVKVTIWVSDDTYNATKLCWFIIWTFHSESVLLFGIFLTLLNSTNIISEITYPKLDTLLIISIVEPGPSQYDS